MSAAWSALHTRRAPSPGMSCQSWGIVNSDNQGCWCSTAFLGILPVTCQSGICTCVFGGCHVQRACVPVTCTWTAYGNPPSKCSQPQVHQPCARCSPVAPSSEKLHCRVMGQASTSLQGCAWSPNQDCCASRLAIAYNMHDARCGGMAQPVLAHGAAHLGGKACHVGVTQCVGACR